ncbi:hypothetical protein B484DRAFT_238820, partial [Ochromonadaceae sp. CCMP2298]
MSEPMSEGSTHYAEDHFGRSVSRSDFQKIQHTWSGSCARASPPLTPPPIAVARFQALTDASATMGLRRTLDLSYCLTDPSAVLLIEVLAMRPLVGRLDLRGNLSPATLRLLLRLLKGQAALVRKIPLDERLHACFLGEVLLGEGVESVVGAVTGGAEGEGAVGVLGARAEGPGTEAVVSALREEVRLLAEALRFANAQAFVRDLFLQLRAAVEPVTVQSVVVVWSNIFGPPDETIACAFQAAGLSAYASASMSMSMHASASVSVSVSDLASTPLTYEQLEGVLLAAFVLRGSLVVLQERQRGSVGYAQQWLVQMDEGVMGEEGKEGVSQAGVETGEAKEAGKSGEADEDDSPPPPPPPLMSPSSPLTLSPLSVSPGSPYLTHNGYAPRRNSFFPPFEKAKPPITSPTASTSTISITVPFALTPNVPTLALAAPTPTASTASTPREQAESPAQSPAQSPIRSQAQSEAHTPKSRAREDMKLEREMQQQQLDEAHQVQLQQERQIAQQRLLIDQQKGEIEAHRQTQAQQQAQEQQTRQAQAQQTAQQAQVRSRSQRPALRITVAPPLEVTSAAVSGPQLTLEDLAEAAGSSTGAFGFVDGQQEGVEEEKGEGVEAGEGAGGGEGEGEGGALSASTFAREPEGLSATLFNRSVMRLGAGGDSGGGKGGLTQEQLLPLVCPKSGRYTKLLFLVLRGNLLTSPEPLQLSRRFQHLTDLDLAHNMLTSVRGLPPTLRRLDLSHNRLTDISPLLTLTALQELDLSFNRIRTFHGLPA